MDYYSADPNVWGPGTWVLLRCIAAEYPRNPSPEIQKTHLTFLEYLGRVLPCPDCRNNYSKNKRTAGFDVQTTLRSRDEFRAYIERLYEAVDSEKRQCREREEAVRRQRAPSQWECHH